MIEYQLPVHWVNKVAIGDRKLGSVTLKFQAQNLFVIADKRLKSMILRRLIIRQHLMVLCRWLGRLLWA